jgi:hypothetical protein
MQKQILQTVTQKITSIETQNLRKEFNIAEEEFKQAAAKYLQKLINEREKTKQN